jgi:hypothetical protein
MSMPLGPAEIRDPLEVQGGIFRNDRMWGHLAPEALWWQAAPVANQNKPASATPTAVPQVSSPGGSGRIRRYARTSPPRQATRAGQKTREGKVVPRRAINPVDGIQNPHRMPTQIQAVLRRFRTAAAAPAAETAKRIGATT